MTNLKYVYYDDTRKLEAGQLEFYAEKFKRLDGTQVDIFNKLPKRVIQGYVMTCEDKYKRKIESKFNYTLIDSGRYGKLYLINSLKDSIVPANSSSQ